MTDSTSDQASSEREEQRRRIRERIREEAKQLKIRDIEGDYKFDNPDLEHKTKRNAKLATLEEKYKDKPKIAFHELSDEGNKLLMQAKRDQVWTTIGWSIVGNVAGVGVVNYIEKSNNQWRALRLFQKREIMKVAAFFGTVGCFTYWGYGVARQQFVRKKIDLVEKYSIKVTDQ